MLKILLVDDESILTETLTKLLDWNRFEGQLVGTASNGEEALVLIEEHHPNVVISDIKMGDSMNGIELSRIVHEKYEYIHMILLTAYGEFEYAQQAISYGVSNYVLKPITRKKLEQLNFYLDSVHQQMLLMRKNYFAVWDGSLMKKIREALTANDQQMLDEFFQSALFEELMSGSNNTFVGLQLIDYLYGYLQEMGIKQEALAVARQRTSTEFIDMTSKYDKMDFLITKYYDILTSINAPIYSQTHKDAIASLASKYIKAHYTDLDFNLSNLSYTMHLSLSHLSTVFKESTGKNMSTYITELRLQKAKELLKDPQYSIADISAKSGYNDSKYFTKLFKKKTGYTPSEYRNALWQGELYEN